MDSMTKSADFLPTLRELSLEDGRAYIQQHSEEAEFADRAATGNLLADEALNQLYTNPAVSLKLADLLIYYGEHTHHSLSHALGLKAKGDALRAMGLHQAAIDNLDAAGQEFLSIGDEGNWARSRISWILAAAWLGRVDDALAEAKRARATFERLNEYYWVGVIDHNTAYIYEQMGRYLDALTLYETMKEQYRALSNESETLIKRAIAVSECNQAIDLALLGQFDDAYRLQQQSHDTFVELNETSCAINTAMNLADLDYMQGYYGSALQRYYSARDALLQSNIDDPLVLAELKLWMAKCLAKLNKLPEASQLADEAITIHRRLHPSLQTSNALREYATILIAAHTFHQALAILDEAWRLFHSSGLDYYAAITKLQQAELLLDTGHVDAAYHEASLLKIYFERRGLQARSVRASLIRCGALLEKIQRNTDTEEKHRQMLLQEALVSGKLVVQLARQQNLQEEVYRAYYLLGRISVLQERPRQATRYLGAAIAQIERMMNNLVFDLSPSFLHTTWAVYEEMIALCLSQQQVERAFVYLEQARSMALRQYLNQSRVSSNEQAAIKEHRPSTPQFNDTALLRTEYELRDWQEKYRGYSVLLADTTLSPEIDRAGIQSALKHCEAKLNELFERLHLYQTGIVPRQKQRAGRNPHVTHKTSIDQLRQQLAPDQLMLAYFLYREKLVIFAATRESLVTREVADGTAQLARLLPLLHAHLQPGGWPNVQHPPQQAVRRLLNKLYALLIAPVAALLPPAGLLTIVPYGPLHKLPFHALYDGEQFLVERCEVQYLPASTLLVHLAGRKNERQQRLTKITAPKKRPLVLGYSSNGQLQRTVNEAKQLAAMLDGRCYLEREATIAHLHAQAPGSPIIHIATHGHSRLDAPNFSYILLADGQLNAIDAFSINLSSCQLVTLSGCETGLSLSGGGDEQLGLGRAFLAAGVDSLVISLWPVEDNATSELMCRFYQRLLRGDTKSQALRAAQCSLLHSESADYAHPYFWAAFRLVGDTDTISL